MCVHIYSYERQFWKDSFRPSISLFAKTSSCSRNLQGFCSTDHFNLAFDRSVSEQDKGGLLKTAFPMNLTSRRRVHIFTYPFTQCTPFTYCNQFTQCTPFTYFTACTHCTYSYVVTNTTAQRYSISRMPYIHTNPITQHACMHMCMCIFVALCRSIRVCTCAWAHVSLCSSKERQEKNVEKIKDFLYHHSRIILNQYCNPPHSTPAPCPPPCVHFKAPLPVQDTWC